MWKIDRDYIAREDDEPKRVGVSGFEPYFTKLPKVRFRMKDDDGNVYYGGWLNDDEFGENQSDALEFGKYDAGCTTIEVKRNGKWVQDIG